MHLSFKCKGTALSAAAAVNGYHSVKGGFNAVLNSVIDYFAYISKLAQELNKQSNRFEKHYYECDCTKLIKAAESVLRLSSDLFLACRELLVLLYAAVPSLPRSAIEDIQEEAMKVSVEELLSLGFPVYKITLPFLLPNKRRRCADFKNALTAAVGSVARRFCAQNKIQPFAHASVFYVSYYDEGSSVTDLVENDNKESSNIQNSLIGCFLRDDRPLVCDTYYCSKAMHDDLPKTEIYIVSQEHDVEVLSFIKSI